MAKKYLDEGHQETDEILEEIESQITKEYSQAEEELQEKLDTYMSEFAEKDEKKKAQVEDGTLDMSEYLTWRTGQVAIGKRWEEMKDTIATDLTNASSIAKSIAVEYMPEVYATNYNYGVYLTEKLSCTDTSYTLYDRSSVQRLFNDDNTFYHKAGKTLQSEIDTGKTKAWNKKQVQSVMIQSLVQGESIDKIANRLITTVGDRNKASSIRNARTMTTGIENAGRMDAGKRAEEMGIGCKKVWMATLDDKTRHWHRSLDMQKKAMDEPFINAYGEIKYPADPSAASANVYNCRCTLGYAVDGVDLDLSDRYDEGLGDMTYEEWKNEKSEEVNAPKGARDIVTEAVGVEKEVSIEISEALKGANSHNYVNNCQRCVQAYEYRRRGYNVTAIDFVESEKVRWGSECFLGDDYSEENAKNAFTFNCYKSKIKEELNNSPDGARYAIYIDWGNDDAHVFIAENDKGTIRYLDPQTGASDVSYYFEEGLDGYYGFFRMDDKQLTTNKEIVRLTVEDNYES